MKDLKNYIKYNEGVSNKVYEDMYGNLTIGVGHNLSANGLSDYIIEKIFEEDIKIARKELYKIFGRSFFNRLPSEVKIVLIDMMFNLGSKKFRKFKNMIKAVKCKDYENVINEMVDSKWCRQLKNRCDRNRELIEKYIKRVNNEK